MTLASDIFAALGGVRSGDGYLVKCPVHDDKTESLSIKDITNKNSEPDIILKCHANCDWKAIKDRLRGMGLLPEFIPKRQTETTLPVTVKSQKVNFIWGKAVQDTETAKKVFAARNINIGHDSPAIRINEYKNERMLAYAMTKPGDEKVLAVQRIAFDSQTYKKSSKGKMFGKNKSGDNYCQGRGVFFYRKKPVDKFIVGEGIETVLSAMQVMEINGCACLSTSGLKGITLPEGIETLYILVDSDKSFGGQKAAVELGKKMVASCKVFYISPCESCFSDTPEKLDFNDLLMSDASGNSIKERFDKAVSAAELSWEAPDTPQENNSFPAETLKELEKMNKIYGAALLSGTFRVLKEGFDGKKHYLSFLKAYDFQLFYQNQKVLTEKDEELKAVPIGKLWLEWEGRRTYSEVTFDPAMNGDKPGTYNMFRGLLAPKKGDWSKMLWHTKNIICDGDEKIFKYVLAWLARAVQDPGGKRPGVAIVLQGGKGIGKGFWCDYLGKLFGESYLVIADAAGFTGNFNMHFSKVVLGFFDEATFGGDKKNKGKLQNMITDPVTLFEPKGIDSISMRNYMNMIIAANDGEWIVPASGDERRYCVLAVNEEKRLDVDYFNALDDEMENGGAAAMMYDLLKYDYSGINLRKAPFTAALSKQIEISLPIAHAFWQFVLERAFLLSDHFTGVPVETKCDEGGAYHWPVMALKYEVYNEFLEFCNKKKERYIISNRAFWRWTWKIWPGGNPGRKQKIYDGELKDVCILPKKSEIKSSFSECTKVFFDEIKSLDENILFDFGDNI